MSSPLHTLTPTKKGALTASSALGRFVDRLLQTFEDCRSGLTDEALSKGEKAVEQYFLDIYAREEARLEDTIRDQPLLTDAAKAKLRAEVDERIRRVVIPAYTRHAVKFTRRERNDFYLTPERLHAVERIGFGLAGIMVGLFVIAAPFIPLWSKEWILPFMIAGLLFPNVRRYLALRRYERELNQLVLATDRELGRIDVAYLTSGEESESAEAVSDDDEQYQKKLASLAAEQGHKER